MLIGDLQIFDEQSWRDDSRSLELLALGDYQPVADEVRRLWPNSQLPTRAIPFVARYVAELTGRYSRALIRRFVAPGQPSESWQKLQAVYSASGMDAAWDSVERQLVVQRSLILLPLPAGMGRVRMLVCLPYQVEVEHGDPLFADDPATWRRLTVVAPQTQAAGQVVNGRIEITPSSAWRDLNGQKVGLFAVDGGNPFGRIPAVVVRLGDAYSGRWHGPIAESVLNLQLALSAQVADNERIIRHCAWPQRVIEGATIAQRTEELVMGADKVVALVGDETNKPTMRVVQGQVPVAELTGYLDGQIRLYCAMLGLDPSAFLRVNTSVTASARLFASQDRQEQKDRVIPVLLAAETQWARLVAEWLSFSELLQLPYRDLTVSVDWLDPTISADPLHDAQAAAARIEAGIDSPVDVVARERGISRFEAVKIVERNRADAKKYLAAMVDPPADPPPEPEAA